MAKKYLNVARSSAWITNTLFTYIGQRFSTNRLETRAISLKAVTYTFVSKGENGGPHGSTINVFTELFLVCENYSTDTLLYKNRS
jgi:hypothetical protein